MNERIRELALQAEVKWLHQEDVIYSTMTLEQFEKFAELIVQECIECADIVGKSNLASGYPNSTAHHVKQKIQEHFGVEE
jgi:hypothetical protein